jgi:hypothetical protein
LRKLPGLQPERGDSSASLDTFQPISLILSMERNWDWLRNIAVGLFTAACIAMGAAVNARYQTHDGDTVQLAVAIFFAMMAAMASIGLTMSIREGYIFGAVVCLVAFTPVLRGISSMRSWLPIILRRNGERSSRARNGPIGTCLSGCAQPMAIARL